MAESEAGLMRRLEAVADGRFDGHLAVLKFTTNWRIGFETPTGRDGIVAMASGKTFHDAALKALAAAGEPGL